MTCSGDLPLGVRPQSKSLKAPFVYSYLNIFERIIWERVDVSVVLSKWPEWLLRPGYLSYLRYGRITHKWSEKFERGPDKARKELPGEPKEGSLKKNVVCAFGEFYTFAIYR